MKKNFSGKAVSAVASNLTFGLVKADCQVVLEEYSGDKKAVRLAEFPFEALGKKDF